MRILRKVRKPLRVGGALAAGAAAFAIIPVMPVAAQSPSVAQQAGSRVTICHKPGTPAEKTLQLPQRAAEQHLAHGDTSGPCRGGEDQQGARGEISLDVHTHSSEFGSPSGRPTLFETTPLPFAITKGANFSYSAIPCEFPAPFNDRALNFTPDYPGIEDPAAVRYLVEGTVTKAMRSGERGTVKGTITTFLCEGKQEGDKIFIEFEAQFVVTSENVATVEGTFRITGGTGRFEDITGSGSFTGDPGFTCLPPVLRRNQAENCADLGAFSDAVFDLRGSFQDPTVPTP